MLALHGTPAAQSISTNLDDVDSESNESASQYSHEESATNGSEHELDSHDTDSDKCDSDTDDSGSMVTDNNDNDDGEVWRWVMERIIGESGRPDLLIPDGSKYDTTKLTKAIRDEVENLMNVTNQLIDTEVYSEIEKEKARLVEQGYEGEEAMKAAWQRRRYLVKETIIKPVNDMMLKSTQNDGK